MIKASGHLVVVLYERNVRPKRIIQFREENVCISATVKGLQSWMWPHIVEYERSDELGGINPPKLVSKIKDFIPSGRYKYFMSSDGQSVDYT
jgi:hypothetical protein